MKTMRTVRRVMKRKSLREPISLLWIWTKRMMLFSLPTRWTNFLFPDPSRTLTRRG